MEKYNGRTFKIKLSDKHFLGIAFIGFDTWIKSAKIRTWFLSDYTYPNCTANDGRKGSMRQLCILGLNIGYLKIHE